MFALFYKFGLNESEHIYIAIIHVICKESKTLEDSAGCHARESPNVKLKTAVIPFAQAATGRTPAYFGPEDIVFVFSRPLAPLEPRRHDKLLHTRRSVFGALKFISF